MKRSWIKSPWTISIGTALFSLFLTMVYDYSKKQPILSTILKILKGILKFVFSILNFNLKVWWVIVGIALVFAIIYFAAKIKQEEILKPDFCSYTEGKFKRWNWTWEWKWNSYQNAWNISDLTAQCPNCGTPLIDQSNMYARLMFDCPRCDYSASYSECDEPHKIERIILDNVKRNGTNKNT